MCKLTTSTMGILCSDSGADCKWKMLLNKHLRNSCHSKYLYFKGSFATKCFSSSPFFLRAIWSVCKPCTGEQAKSAKKGTVKFVVKARIRASSRDEQYSHLCSQLMCCKHGLQKQRYTLPRIHIFWRLPYAWLLAVAENTSPQNIYSNQSKRQSTAKIWEGSEGMGRCGGCPAVCLSQKLLFYACIEWMIRGWWAAFVLLLAPGWFYLVFSFAKWFWFLWLFVLTAEVLHLCRAKLNARLRMSPQNNWWCFRDMTKAVSRITQAQHSFPACFACVESLSWNQYFLGISYCEANLPFAVEPCSPWPLHCPWQPQESGTNRNLLSGGKNN